MKRWVCLALVVAMMSTSLGCFSMRHTVGSGPSTGVKTKERQWYALWGLVRLGREDSKDMAGSTENYRVTTKHGVFDIVINLFTGIVSVCSRTIVVER